MLVASRSALGQAGFKLSALKNQLVFSDTCLLRPPSAGSTMPPREAGCLDHRL